jgi:alginate O-acetyltransferase complex protein AlgI
MQFFSFDFLLFLAITAIVFRVIPRRWRGHWILLASYAFYCTWDVRMAILLLVATVFCFVAGLQIRELRNRKAASVLTLGAVSAFVLYLAFFKARPLIASGASVAIPLGISYYTFRLISYLLDVYWGKYDAERQFVPFAAYVAFFPHLVAGPIQRASSFLPQLNAPQNWQSNSVLAGLARIMLGFFKKSVVADNLGLFVDYGYQHMQSGSAIPHLAAFYLYPLQLYADFGGLTDIAIGTGLLLGIESPENFDLPFWATSITEFWRRWHMTLTSFLRDYVFIPLRMATRSWGQFGLILSLILIMLLIGIWHGFSMGFLAFGLFHGIALTIDTMSSSRCKKYYQRNPRVALTAAFFGPVLTYNIVSVGNTFFRAPSFGSAAQMLGGLTSNLTHIGSGLSALVAPPNHYAWVAFPGLVLAEIADWIRSHKGLKLPALAPRWIRWSAYACMTLTCIFVALLFLARQPGADPFVYAKF